MANSTWLQLTNATLLLAGLDPIPDDGTTFNVGPMAKYQDATKRFIQLGHQMMCVKAFRHFAERLIPLQGFEGQSDYPLDTGMSPEGITLRSFFNVSPNVPQSYKNTELRNWKYEEWLRRNNNPTINATNTGPPTRWILLPLNRTALSPIHMVRLWPTPDDNYLFQYKAKLNAYPLTLDTSIVLWPQEYEHVLTMFAWDLLERDLGEGKEGNIKALADKALAEVKLVSGVPEDIRKAPRTMRLPSRRRMGWYNSPISVDPNSGAILD